MISTCAQKGCSKGLSGLFYGAVHRDVMTAPYCAHVALPVRVCSLVRTRTCILRNISDILIHAKLAKTLNFTKVHQTLAKRESQRLVLLFSSPLMLHCRVTSGQGSTRRC